MGFRPSQSRGPTTHVATVSASPLPSSRLPPLHAVSLAIPAQGGAPLSGASAALHLSIRPLPLLLSQPLATDTAVAPTSQGWVAQLCRRGGLGQNSRREPLAGHPHALFRGRAAEVSRTNLGCFSAQTLACGIRWTMGANGGRQLSSALVCRFLPGRKTSTWFTAAGGDHQGVGEGPAAAQLCVAALI